MKARFSDIFIQVEQDENNVFQYFFLESILLTPPTQRCVFDSLQLPIIIMCIVHKYKMMHESLSLILNGHLIL